MYRETNWKPGHHSENYVNEKKKLCCNYWPWFFGNNSYSSSSMYQFNATICKVMLLFCLLS